MQQRIEAATAAAFSPAQEHLRTFRAAHTSTDYGSCIGTVTEEEKNVLIWRVRRLLTIDSRVESWLLKEQVQVSVSVPRLFPENGRNALSVDLKIRLGQTSLLIRRLKCNHLPQNQWTSCYKCF